MNALPLPQQLGYLEMIIMRLDRIEWKLTEAGIRLADQNYFPYNAMDRDIFGIHDRCHTEFRDFNRLRNKDPLYFSDLCIQHLQRYILLLGDKLGGLEAFCEMKEKLYPGWLDNGAHVTFFDGLQTSRQSLQDMRGFLEMYYADLDAMTGKDLPVVIDVETGEQLHPVRPEREIPSFARALLGSFNRL